MGARSCKMYLYNSIENNRLPILVGGTGFYIRNLMNGHYSNGEVVNFCPDIHFETAIITPTKRINIMTKHCKELKECFHTHAMKLKQ